MTTNSVGLLVPVAAIDHARGAVHARITIVEYGDFECPVCRAVEPGVRMLLDRWQADVRNGTGVSKLKP
jgi:protein-disulfide isomerase